MKSIIVVSTPTSATGSLWRLVSAFASQAGYKTVKISEKYDSEGKIHDLLKFQPEPYDHCYLYNTPQLWSGIIDLRSIKVLVNFRDPRDLICNQYHWIFQHARKGETEEEIAKLHELVRIKGIDQFALEQNTSSWFKAFEAEAGFFKSDENCDFVRVSYNQMCLDYNLVIKKLTTLIPGINLDCISDLVDMERPDRLTMNPHWIGQHWTGSDIAPGRYKAELNNFTIKTLNQKYGSILELLKLLDEPKFTKLYE